jgi:hypothetical protein
MKPFFVLLFLSFSLTLSAQQNQLEQAEAVKTIDGLLTRMLDLLSVEKGNKIDTALLRELFMPNATLSTLSHDDNYAFPFETVSLDDFVESLKDSYYEAGFKEEEISKVVNEFNGIANVFQSFTAKDSENIAGRGINSYQLVYLKNRWWIANMVWTFETENVKIPKKYLKSDSKKM